MLSEKLADCLPVVRRLALDPAQYARGIAPIGPQPTSGVRVLYLSEYSRFNPVHAHLGQESQNHLEPPVASGQRKGQGIRFQHRIEQGHAAPKYRAVTHEKVARTVPPFHHAPLSHDFEVVVFLAAQLEFVRGPARCLVQVLQRDFHLQTGGTPPRGASISDGLDASAALEHGRQR